MKGAGARTIVAFGDSITDGTGSTINGDDRWPDVLSRRLRAIYGNAYAVVNAGIGANMIAGPADWATKPWAGGAPASERLERDVLSLSGVAAIIWLEGINDFAFTKNDPSVLETVVRDVVARLRQRIPGVRIVMATAMSAKNSTIASHGTAEVDEKRRALNQFIRTSGLFDAVVDFDELMSDPQSGELKAEYRPNSSIGGPGDKLHPNRAGYAAMARAIDLKALLGEPK
jgi:lysophospholipase L1-like esterase